MNPIRIEVSKNAASGWIISPASAGIPALSSAALTPLNLPRQEVSEVVPNASTAGCALRSMSSFSITQRISR